MLYVLEGVLFFIACFSICYYVAIGLYAGKLLHFSSFWLFAATLSALLALAFFFLDKNSTPFLFAIEGVFLFFIAMALCFLIGMYLFLKREGTKKPVDGIPFLIVLGAKVNGVTPSRALRRRIEKAYEYLAENENTIAILSGGQGKDEQISEACCMQRQLLKKGIQKERLILEEQSRTTRENIKFSKKWIKKKSNPILVVTSDFHVCRGIAIAKGYGFLDVYGLGARTDAILVPHYYMRESFAWIKYWMLKKKG